jgi:hypothetical protein
MHHNHMRTTLEIDATVLEAVTELARREGRSRGAVVSTLIRRALSQPAPGDNSESAACYGFRPFPARRAETFVTNGQVNRLREEQGI